jgi:hypothetical protein
VSELLLGHAELMAKLANEITHFLFHGSGSLRFRVALRHHFRVEASDMPHGLASRAPTHRKAKMAGKVLNCCREWPNPPVPDTSVDFWW